MASPEAGHITLFYRAAHEGTQPALYDPQHDHDEKVGREMALDTLMRCLISGATTATVENSDNTTLRFFLRQKWDQFAL